MKTKSRECIHCGTRFSPNREDEKFCCSGCEFVYQMIQESGKEHFYDLKTVTNPVRSTPFKKEDYSSIIQWFNSREEKALEQKQQSATAKLDLKGISCIACTWLVENLFNEQEGAQHITVSPQQGKVEIQWTLGKFDIENFAILLQNFGYILSIPSKHKKQISALTLKIGIAAALAMNAMLFTLPGYLGMNKDFEYASLFQFMSFFCSTASLIFCGSYFFKRALSAVKRGSIHIDLPIALGIIAAYIGSVFGYLQELETLIYFDFVSIFIFLMLTGRWTQENAIAKNHAKLLQNTPYKNEIQVKTENGTETIPVEELNKKQILEIYPGDNIPVSSELKSSTALLSLEWINGESAPRVFKQGNIVPSGAINASSEMLCLESIENWNDSVLSKLIKQTETQAPNRLLEKILKNYLVVVIVIAFIAGIAWSFSNPILGVQVAISILVVSCPCALGVAIPFAGEVALSKMSKQGVFIKKVELWQRLLKVKQIIFDKTGTLTLENPRLKNPKALDQLEKNERDVLMTLTSQSFHPISRSLREKLIIKKANNLKLQVLEEPGFGLSLITKVDNEEIIWRLGRPGWNTNLKDSKLDNSTDTQFSCNGRVLCNFSFEDSLRDNATESLQKLIDKNLEISILSGDKTEKVNKLATELGVALYHKQGDMTPQEKADWIDKNASKKALMIGDGANDSLAFSAAYCTGTPVIDKSILEPKSDFFFLDRGIQGIELLFNMAVRYNQTLRKVFAFSISYNILAIAICISGHMNPLLAAILMPISSIITIAIVMAGIKTQ